MRREVVTDLQTRDLPEQLVDEAEIVASELLTNAVRHARPLSDGTIRVRWKIRGDVVEVEVTDGGGESVPRPAPRTVWLSSGRGPAHRALDRPRVGRHRGPHRQRRVGHPRRPQPPPRHLTASRTRVAHGQGISTSARLRLRIRASRPAPAPFERRPFEGLEGETDWVALREILPAATATVTVRPEHVPDGAPGEVTVATVLPMAWPGLHRADGTVLIGTQSGNASGDASRDLAAQLLAAPRGGAGPAGRHDRHRSPPTARASRTSSCRHRPSTSPCTRASTSGSRARTSRARPPSRSSGPTPRSSPPSRMAALPSAYWVRIGDRTHIRLVLPDDEDAATDALARLHAAGDDGLGGDTRLLGAFRACGLLVPVWDLDPTLEAGDYEDELTAWGERYAAALAADAPLTAEERRARSGLLSRQVTLR